MLPRSLPRGGEGGGRTVGGAKASDEKKSERKGEAKGVICEMGSLPPLSCLEERDKCPAAAAGGRRR